MDNRNLDTAEPSTSYQAARNVDDAITTSTESDTFDTWTLVTDKNKLQTDYNIETDNSSNRVQILPKDPNANVWNESPVTQKIEDKKQEDEQNEPTHDKEDASDGISIISESDSSSGGGSCTGCITLHPQLCEHFNNMNSAMNPNENLPLYTPFVSLNASKEEVETELRQRRRKRGNKAQSLVDNNIVVTRETLLAHPIVRRGLTGFFYVSVFLALLTLLGKMNHSEWTMSISKVEQKLINIELQNNLMRAEIDFLSQQVKYLNSLNENGQFGSAAGKGMDKHKTHPQQKQNKQQKSFKSWSDNGNNIDPIDIKKDDLKHAYQCQDGKFVEIAEMCVENKQPDEDNSATVSDSADTIIEQTETFKAFEKIAESINAVNKAKSEGASSLPPPISNEPIKKAKEKVNSKDYKYSAERVDRKYVPKYKEYEKNDKQYKRDKHYDFDDDDLKKNHNKVKYHSKERQYDSKERQYDSKERKYDERKCNSNERKCNSRERFSNNENSKERFDRQRKRDSSEEKFDKNNGKDGNWQEKLMQYRETKRRLNDELRNNKNWYIKRGDGRAEKRDEDVRLR